MHATGGLINFWGCLVGEISENGGFSGGLERVRFRAGSLARFWKRVRKQGECWVWQGPVSGLGYPVACLSGVQGGHRIAWVWKHGVAPAGCLRNRCGDLSCVNPAHWREDGPRPVSRVKRRHAEIRRLFVEGVGIGEIADRVGCSRSTVWRQTHGLEVGNDGGHG